MKPSNKKAAIISCVILATAIVIAAMVVFLPKRSITPAAPAQQVTVPGQHASNNGPSALLAGSTTSPKMAPIPHGLQTYQIMQAATVMPKIVQATVNPVDVHVGDTQTLTVIVSDPNPVTSVVATVRTDNGTTTVPLSLVGPAALNDVFPQTYFVNAQNQLALVSSNKTAGVGNIAQAAQGDEKYSATWKVVDTHVARYSTVFTATDAKGNVNSARLYWTDALCSWDGNNNNNGVTSSIGSVFGSDGCSFANNETDGVENGNLLIDAPVTLAHGSSLVINSGNTLSFSGSGNLLILTTPPLGQIQFSDMYCASSGWVTTFASPADGTDQIVRSSLSNNVFPGQTAYFTTPTLTNYGANTWNYNCDNTITTQPATQPTSCYVVSYSTCSGGHSCNVVCGVSASSTIATSSCGGGYNLDCHQSTPDGYMPPSCGIGTAREYYGASSTAAYVGCY
jgi:hypothetical protein